MRRAGPTELTSTGSHGPHSLGLAPLASCVPSKALLGAPDVQWRCANPLDGSPLMRVVNLLDSCDGLLFDQLLLTMSPACCRF
jgi:hypothetical protein